jgi:hypothetical protein
MPSKLQVLCWSVVGLLGVAAMGCGAAKSAREAARKTQSANNMKQITLAILELQQETGKWPEKLDEISVKLGPLMADIMKNPVTGDNPGYEYVRPQDDESRSDVPMLFQLRNGKRDTSLRVGFTSGAVRDLE